MKDGVPGILATNCVKSLKQCVWKASEEMVIEDGWKTWLSFCVKSHLNCISAAFNKMVHLFLVFLSFFFFCQDFIIM